MLCELALPARAQLVKRRLNKLRAGRLEQVRIEPGVARWLAILQGAVAGQRYYKEIFDP